MSLSAFVSYSRKDSGFVLQTVAILKRHMEVFAYEENRNADEKFIATIRRKLKGVDVFVVFVGRKYEESLFQKMEVAKALRRKRIDDKLQIVPVSLHADAPMPRGLLAYDPIHATDDQGSPVYPVECARWIVYRLREGDANLQWRAEDDLPFNPHLFSYEKDIIRSFARRLELGENLYRPSEGEEEIQRVEDRRKIEEGCPTKWPEIYDLRKEVSEQRVKLHQNDGEGSEAGLGAFRDDVAKVGAAALRGLESFKKELTLPEAGPRAELLFPVTGPKGILRVGVLVSGGIAPGINAVIDGIVQRHWKYMRPDGHRVMIFGYQNGFHGLLEGYSCQLFPDEASFRNDGRAWGQVAHRVSTSEFANQGGSVLGTHRLNELLSPRERLGLLRKIASLLSKIDILYMIGGDGTMKAAHALWSVAKEQRVRDSRKYPLSVVGIPKTMDNDILWVWQSFGFMSAVEKAREVIQNLHTEVSSNPRLCVLQLFGSDSGFVVSHAVLASAAGHCDLALIPEVPFSLLGIVRHLEGVIGQRQAPIPGGLVVMAETAIPVDAIHYVRTEADPLPPGLETGDREIAESIRKGVQLSEADRLEIERFHETRLRGERIQGQTPEALRRAGLNLLMQGLEAGLRSCKPNGDAGWRGLRTLASEPRQLLRAVPPSTADIIMGQRLGTLAVDNAMAGYTDFMISQWLTEYVLVPLKLVVLGRKRIPESGVFWKSVLAKTHQSGDLVFPWPRS